MIRIKYNDHYVQLPLDIDLREVAIQTLEAFIHFMSFYMHSHPTKNKPVPVTDEVKPGDLCFVMLAPWNFQAIIAKLVIDGHLLRIGIDPLHNANLKDSFLVGLASIVAKNSKPQLDWSQAYEALRIIENDKSVNKTYKETIPYIMHLLKSNTVQYYFYKAVAVPHSTQDVFLLPA